MKVIKKLFVMLVVIFVVLFLAKNFVIKAAIEGGAKLATGLDLKIEKFNLGFIATDLRIENLVIYNPKEFKERIMLHIPEVYIDVNVRDIIGGTIHVDKVVFNIEEFNVVKNEAGDVNLDAFKVVSEGQEKPVEKVEKPKEKKPGKAMKFQIDHFVLDVGQIAFITYTKGQERPAINKFEFNLHEEYEHITNPQVLAAILIQKAILKASMEKLNIDFGGVSAALQNTVGSSVESVKQISGKVTTEVKDLTAGTIGAATDVGTKTVGTATQVGTKAVDTATNTAKGATDAVKESASKLKSLAGGLLGSKE